MILNYILKLYLNYDFNIFIYLFNYYKIYIFIIFKSYGIYDINILIFNI